ncbi:MAG: lasso peptide biosynthesis B2 protein [Erythrobacter sp.]|jgi:hypothetical protein|nr:lasso peptide biosynthesis B2 protein [Erythrobacter sp.]
MLTARAPSPVELAIRNTAPEPATLSAHQTRLVERVAWALPRAASVVPWRSDCLRQAEAGRRWLGRHGIKSEIRLGARSHSAGLPEMHAWLIVAERVVTGGDISPFTPFGGGDALQR